MYDRAVIAYKNAELLPVILLAILAGALLNRIRGGWLADIIPGGATTKRIAFGAGAGLYAWLAGVAWWQGAILAALVWLGMTFGWGAYMDMGRNPRGHLDAPEKPISWLLGRPGRDWSLWRRWCFDAAGMTLRGLLLFGPLALVLPWPIVAGALLMPLCYEIGWRVPSTLPHFTRGPEIAELLFGGTTYGAIFLVASLDGYSSVL